MKQSRRERAPFAPAPAAAASSEPRYEGEEWVVRERLEAGDDRIVVIEQGRRPTAGYQVAVSRVAELRGSELSLHVTMLSPRPGAMTAQMITSPCVVVGVPRVDIRKLRVIDQSGEQRAVWYR